MAAGRNATIWQQGFIIDGKDSVALGLIAENELDEKVAVIVSHDCDLVESAEIEPKCEIIVGRKIPQAGGTFSHAKHPRRLHLTFSGGTTSLVLELNSIDKQTIDKSAVFALSPIAQVQLLAAELWTLRCWLASRYFRPSYPDEFDRRLKANDVYKRIANTIKNTGNELIAVLFDLDSGQPAVEKVADDPYVLRIFLVYDVSKDPAKALATAKTAAQSIKGILLFQRWEMAGHRVSRLSTDFRRRSRRINQLRMTRLWYFDAFEIVFEKKP